MAALIFMIMALVFAICFLIWMKTPNGKKSLGL
jgi:hypothetical protein